MLGRLRIRGITGRLIIPYVTISVLVLALVGTMFIRSQSATVSRMLAKKAESTARNVALGLSDIFFVYDYCQRLLDATKKMDDDVVYMILIDNDGRAVASTDPAVRNQVLNRNAFETAALLIR